MTKRNDHQNKPEEQSNFPTISLPDSSAVIGGEIGPYKLLSVLGEGGFGIVYLAEQKHPVKRKVALKIIKPGMDSKQVIARFEAERQALALLEQPNIAHVFRAGSTEAGRPYFAMEYIKGSPITEYCDQNKLSIKERLKLFIQVCEAIQHAHQKGIIHRDIKPSNIIVSVQDGKATPKVIDFGVAKAVNLPLTDKTMFTQQGQLIGTPEYMSPEQADSREKDIDTRTDIYSLGVVLYELLAGALPFEPETLREGGYAEIQRIIREQEPPHPSTKLSSLGDHATEVAQSRQIELSTLVKSLHKELEWIPLMAIRKDREQRYKTASDLAEDVQNYLNGNPLVAGPESAAYRFNKFMRKHRGLVAAVTAIISMLIIGISVSITLYIQAEQARDKAQQQLEISQTVLDFVNNDLFGIDQLHPTAHNIKPLKSVLEAHKNVEGKFEDIPLVKASIYHTLGMVYLRWREFDAAKLCIENSLAIRRDELGSEHPNTLYTMSSLATVYWHQLNYKKAQQIWKRTSEIQKQILGIEHPDTLRSMQYLGVTYAYEGDYKKTRQIWEEILDDLKRVMGVYDYYTLSCMRDLTLLYSFLDDFDKAVEIGIEALNVHKKTLGSEHKNTLKIMHRLGRAYLEQGNYEMAEQLYAERMNIQYKKVGIENPNSLFAMQDLAQVYYVQKNFDKAIQFYMDRLDILKQTVGPDHQSTLILIDGLHATQGFKELIKDPQRIPSQSKFFNGHHYFLCPQKMTWVNAKEYSESVGGHLVTITTKEENDWIIKNFPPLYEYWLGGSDENEEGNWKWVTEEKWQYSKWNENQPDNQGGVEHFLKISDNGNWIDIHEYLNKFSFLIEWDR